MSSSVRRLAGLQITTLRYLRHKDVSLFSMVTQNIRPNRRLIYVQNHGVQFWGENVDFQV